MYGISLYYIQYTIKTKLIGRFSKTSFQLFLKKNFFQKLLFYFYIKIVYLFPVHSE